MNRKILSLHYLGLGSLHFLRALRAIVSFYVWMNSDPCDQSGDKRRNLCGFCMYPCRQWHLHYHFFVAGLALVKRNSPFLLGSDKCSEFHLHIYARTGHPLEMLTTTCCSTTNSLFRKIGEENLPRLCLSQEQLNVFATFRRILLLLSDPVFR